LEKKLNKYIINALDPSYELVFVGLDDDEEGELDADIKKMGAFMTINEIRQKRGMKSIEGGDIIANQYFTQMKQAQMMGNPDSNQVAEEDDENVDDNDTQKSIHTDPLLASFVDLQKSILTTDV